ncbi:MAG: Sporulation-specific N-acetylmuramoyl-L-alanine amidase [Firmicutes bacterium ADurb.Bin506]|nr:MAG: Sporulation-specific N-acetylmuramoyl-L-alanine amidase [Firmicutes bacterium ADurb.Bin506]
MAFLTPDKVIKAVVGKDTLTINVKITPDGARNRSGAKVKAEAKLNGGTGKPKGITVHNTGDIKVASGTNAAEQYARATWPNCNMGQVAVHYWVWHDVIWQQLDDTERGWHAADGSSRRSSHRAGQTIGGNLDTISIECIGPDAASEETTAKLVAYLLKKHGLDPSLDIYTHQYFYAKKKCPLYILPHWDTFIATVKRHYEAATAPTGATDGGGAGTDTPGAETPATAPTAPAKTLYRVQTGAFSKLANAKALETKLKAAGFTTYLVKSGSLYKVQCGAFAKKANATALAAKLKAAGYETYITTKSGEPV